MYTYSFCSFFLGNHFIFYSSFFCHYILHFELFIHHLTICVNKNLYLFSVSADAYIIQIQKYEVNTPAAITTTTPVTSSNALTAKATASTSTTTNANQVLTNANIIRLPSTGQSLASSLVNLSSVTSLAGVTKTLGILGSNAKTNIKMAITQAATASTNKTNIVTSPKAVTQSLIQLGGQIKNQHLTLAALNQLTAGKLATSTTGAKTVQIISPAKGQTIKQQLVGAKQGVNMPILTSTASTASSIKVGSSAVTTTTAQSTQYALVRAQLPSTSGGPAQTVTFIRAIGANSSSAAGNTTVSVTPQQMAALLKGQQNGAQSQIQKVLGAAAAAPGTAQLRPQNPINVANSLKMAAQNNSSKLVSVQIPQKVGGVTQMKTVTVGSILGGKVSSAVTTQATHVSPMATLVSASGTKLVSTGSSLVNQFPAVRPASITVLTKTTTTTSTTSTNSESVTSTTGPLTEIPPAEPTAVTGEADVKEVKQEPGIDSAADLKTLLNTDEIKEEPSEVVAGDIKKVEGEDQKADIPMDEAAPLITTQPKDEISSSTATGVTTTENGATTSKMEIDQDEKPPVSVTAAQQGEGVDKKQQQEQSSESVAATTLAQLASIASDASTPASVNDMSNPLSTLAALASSSPIATAPLVNGAKVVTLANAKKVITFEFKLKSNQSNFTGKAKMRLNFGRFFIKF